MEPEGWGLGAKPSVPMEVQKGQPPCCHPRLDHSSSFRDWALRLRGGKAYIKMLRLCPSKQLILWSVALCSRAG